MNPTESRTAPPTKKVNELRVPLARAVKKRIALAAIEQGTTQGKLALRFILDGLDGLDRAKPS